MKIKLTITVLLVIGFAIFGCKKYDTDYKKFLDHKEVIYPGLATGVGYHPGNLRVLLVWHPSPDPSIKNYVVSWNNGLDSVIVNATSHSPADSITVSIPGLKEYVYSFRIIAHDNDGNTSVGQDINNVRVYGAVYVSALFNRGYNTANPYQLNDDGSVTLYFNKADTGNVSTTIKYTNKLGVTAEKSFGPKDKSVTLTDYKLGTPLQYRSAYKPVADAVDVFDVKNYDDFPIIYNVVECDKSLFKAYNLPTDVPSAYGWETYYLWDKSTNEPGFHTPGQDFPIWFTFDMGQQASLAKMKIWQRTSGLYNYGNPKRFEIYGSNNPTSNGDFSNWVKLGSFTSVKPSGLPTGQNSQADADFAAAGEPFAFPAGLASYRYIRFKVLETWGGGNYFHLLELTMYKIDK
jgi:hypothetical protein